MKKDENNLKDIYNTFFTDYPDVLNIQQLSEILGGIGKKDFIYNVTQWNNFIL